MFHNVFVEYILGKQIEKKISERDIGIEELFQMIRDAVDAKATDTKQKDFLTSLARTWRM